ncbi:hypothetical protein DEJ01_12635 [Curtobacterium sp. MCLR17_040]|uniref:hypothetical protein n=1 Tax=Curtobacterium sp. MCLR17_040 TaxID=2175625 RepID=UPI000DAA17D2|nr:hypothetical protein [Curtobacterium sp. MCLR17_040]PZF00639.1 hypothetical protein DEJ01_12635 [Curtobacterium sp. MCLR17_040]
MIELSLTVGTYIRATLKAFIIEATPYDMLVEVSRTAKFNEDSPALGGLSMLIRGTGWIF